MGFKSNKQYTSADLRNIKYAVKILFIIAFWESLIMTLLPQIGTLSPLAEGIIDTTLLTILSSLSIWFAIIIPEKKRNEAELSSSINILDQKTSAINDIAIVSTTDLDGKITYANENFCTISGYSREELLQNDHRIINSGTHSKEFFREMWSTLKAGRPWRGQIKNKKKNGEYYWVDSYIVPIHDTQGNIYNYLSFRFDITTEKLIAEALEQEKLKNIQMSRLSAIGEMAGGIAHEINNPLMIISASLLSIRRKLENPEMAKDIPGLISSIEKSQKQVLRTTKIIKGLREFSRSDEILSKETISISKIFDSISDFCSDKIQRLDIQFEIKYESVELQCNPVQIEQVLFNLIKNSMDAIRDRSDKWISIDASSRGEFIVIKVTDSGRGIDSRIAEKIMQPFFTTKEIGEGMGMGLSISRGIVEKHGGTFYYDSKSPNTCFVIELPLQSTAQLDVFNIDEAISTHLGWRQKLIEHFSSPNNELDPDIVGNDSHCALGRWINQIESEYNNNPDFKDLKSAHTEFHKFAGEIIRQGRNQKSMTKLNVSDLNLGSGSDYDRKSQKVVSALHVFRRYYPTSKSKLKNCG